MIRVLLIDDHRIIREGITMLLETMDAYEVIGEAENGQAGLDILKTIQPDIILLDLNMPVLDGIGFLEAFMPMGLDIPVVVLTTLDDQDKIQTAMAKGAQSYLLKDTSRDTLNRTLQAAVAGEMLLTKAVTQKLLRPQTPVEASVSYEDFGLTERELQIIGFVAKGDTNKAIAIEMAISERTVKAHLTHIYEKMGVASRAEAVAKALANKMIPL